MFFSAGFSSSTRHTKGRSGKCHPRQWPLPTPPEISAWLVCFCDDQKSVFLSPVLPHPGGKHAIHVLKTTSRGVSASDPQALRCFIRGPVCVRRTARPARRVSAVWTGRLGVHVWTFRWCAVTSRVAVDNLQYVPFCFGGSEVRSCAGLRAGVEG